MNEKDFITAMERIIAALKERDYDPYAQLYGYITEREPIYITSHNDARNLIQSLDFDMVSQYVQKMEKPSE